MTMELTLLPWYARHTRSDVCTACRGTGRVKLYKHRAPNRRYGRQKQGYRSMTCPACGGVKLPTP